METFKPHPLLHPFCIGFTAAMSWLAWRISVDEMVRGGMAARIGLLLFVLLLGGGTLVHYLLTGFKSFEITDEGLTLRRPWSSTFFPWSEISRIDNNPYLQFIVFHSRTRVIALTSCFMFPRICELIRSIHKKSECSLTPMVAFLLELDSARKRE